MGSGASYAMDMGKEYKPNENAPENWERLLRGTIDYMQQFEDFAVRYLMIVCPSRGNSEISEYSGTFPKSSSKATTIVACTKLDDDVDNLVAWVEENIK